MNSSELLLEIAKEIGQKHKLTYGSLVEKLGERSFGLGILLFSLPSALPLSIIPGFSVIFSIPIAIFAIHMLFVQKTLWLPKFIAEREVPGDKLAKVIKKSVPYLQKAERFLKPRWEFMTSRVAESISGLMIFFLAILLMLPIPFSNFIYSIVLIIFGLGISEKDGLLVSIGFIAGTIALGIIPLLFALVKSLF